MYSLLTKNIFFKLLPALFSSVVFVVVVADVVVVLTDVVDFEMVETVEVSTVEAESVEIVVEFGTVATVVIVVVGEDVVETTSF